MKNVELVKFEKEDAMFIQTNFPTWFFDNSIQNIESKIESWKDSLCFCIKYDNKKVGIITLGQREEKSLVWGVAVKEDYRGKGIAQKAFSLIKEKAKQKGFDRIISSCSSDNAASKRLHEQVGFTLVKTEVNQAGNKMHRWEMLI